MTKQEIIDYVMNTPANTNPNVLKTMLDSGSGGSGETLPPITVENIGQVLGVVPDFDNVSPKEVIPEQTVTIVDKAVEVTADWGPYWHISKILAKINGIEYDAIFMNNQYEVAIPTDEDFMYVHVSREDDGSSVTTYFNAVEDRGRTIPGNYNISFTIMAPGVKYGLIKY